MIQSYNVYTIDNRVKSFIHSQTSTIQTVQFVN